MSNKLTKLMTPKVLISSGVCLIAIIAFMLVRVGNQPTSINAETSTNINSSSQNNSSTHTTNESSASSSLKPYEPDEEMRRLFKEKLKRDYELSQRDPEGNIRRDQQNAQMNELHQRRVELENAHLGIYP